MIQNDEQYERTKEWRRKFEEAAQAPVEPSTKIHPVIQVAMRAAYASQAAELKEEMDEYIRRTGRQP